MNEKAASHDVLTVCLNPALDLTFELKKLTVGAINKSKAVQWHVGGKGINVATCLSDVQVAVAATGILGEKNCELFDEHFAKRQIKDLFVRHAGANRVNMKIADVERNQTTDVNSQGDIVGAKELETVEKIVASDSAKWVVLSGSLPPGLSEATYVDLIAFAHKRGAKVILDTAERPFELALSGRPFLVKPNLTELEIFAGKKLDSITSVRDEAKKLVSRGISKVAVSLGGEGAIFVDEKEAWHAQALPVAVVSNVGAGDAMVAGLVTALREGRNWRECAMMGVAFSTAKLEKVGPQIPSRKRVNELFEKVAVTSI